VTDIEPDRPGVSPNNRTEPTGAPWRWAGNRYRTGLSLTRDGRSSIVAESMRGSEPPLPCPKAFFEGIHRGFAQPVDREHPPLAACELGCGSRSVHRSNTLELANLNKTEKI
jgi:hypothetical protein